MARVFIDVNMFSLDWFKPVLSELVASKSVNFAFSGSAMMTSELDKVRQGLQFYKTAGQLRDTSGRSRRVDASVSELERQERIISNQQCFIDSSDCDDPHIFALIYTKPTPFVFSTDVRLARCRDHINQYMQARYCGFIVVSSADVYNKHRQHILN